MLSDRAVIIWVNISMSSDFEGPIANIKWLLDTRDKGWN